MNEPHGDLLTVNEVCEILKTNKYDVYRLIHSGALAAVRNRPGGSRYRVPRQAVDEYLAGAFTTPVVENAKGFRTVAEVARQLGCSPETIRRLVASGELPATRFAGRTSRLRIDNDAVDAYLRRHQAKNRGDEESA